MYIYIYIYIYVFTYYGAGAAGLAGGRAPGRGRAIRRRRAALPDQQTSWTDSLKWLRSPAEGSLDRRLPPGPLGGAWLPGFGRLGTLAGRKSRQPGEQHPVRRRHARSARGGPAVDDGRDPQERRSLPRSRTRGRRHECVFCARREGLMGASLPGFLAGLPAGHPADAWVAYMYV